MAFSPTDFGSIKYAQRFSKNVAGAESNVAIGLSKMGHSVGWVSKLGKDPLGQFVISTIKGEGVDVSQVSYSNNFPTGIYFKDKLGFGETKVYYYRHGSAASRLCPEDINEEYISRARFMHLTGITPALGKSCFDAVNYAIDMARKNGIAISFDPNIRLKLWDESTAKEVLLSLIKKVDICLPGIEEAKFITGVDDPEEQANILMALGPKTVVIKLGKDGAYFKTAHQSGYVPAYQVDHYVDNVGAGDGFAVGLLSGLIDNEDLAKAVNRGCVIGAYAVTTKGDFEGYPTRDELEVILGDKPVVTR